MGNFEFDGHKYKKASDHQKECTNMKIATVNGWKAIYAKHRPLLNPNRKSTVEIIEYISSKYLVEEDTSDKAKSVVYCMSKNITMNEWTSRRIPNGKTLDITVFHVKNEGNATALYQKQSKVFKDVPIMIGLERETGFVSVEGSEELTDEITAFKGLDLDELNNFYLVANYIRCLENIIT